MWFHNVEFRSALYSWIPLDEPVISQAPSKNNMEVDGKKISFTNDNVQYLESYCL